MGEGVSFRARDPFGSRARGAFAISPPNMQKLLLVSILVATVAIPVLMSREKTRAEGVKRTVKWMVGICVLYLLGLLYLYPRLEGL
jgi:hypothetical protein